MRGIEAKPHHSLLVFLHPLVLIDQVEILALREGVSVQEIERWMSPVLAYEPGASE